MNFMSEKQKENNFAFIDAANLDKGIKSLNWRLDYKRFRVWLKEKYSVTKAYPFIDISQGICFTEHN